MSRIGRKPILVPPGVTVEVDDANVVTVKGPKGTLHEKIHSGIEVKVDGAEVHVTRPNDDKEYRSLHGLSRTLINNMVVGVTEGYKKTLQINGTGYRAQKSGKTLTLFLGYSHQIDLQDPEGIESSLEGQNTIVIQGIDKEKVGQYAAEIRSKREPEPYKGKGIKYDYENIRRKAGKTGKK